MMNFYISSILEEMNTVMPRKYTGSGNRQITEIHKILIKYTFNIAEVYI
jgi:hypothetical protein